MVSLTVKIFIGVFVVAIIAAAVAASIYFNKKEADSEVVETTSTGTTGTTFENTAVSMTKDGDVFSVLKRATQNYIVMDKEDLKLIAEYISAKRKTNNDVFVCSNSQTLKIQGVDGRYDNAEADGMLRLITYLSSPIPSGGEIAMGQCPGSPYSAPTFASSNDENSVRVVGWTSAYMNGGSYTNNYIGIPTVETSKIKVGDQICVSGKNFTIGRIGPLDQEGGTFVYFTELLGSKGARATIGSTLKIGGC